MSDNTLASVTNIAVSITEWFYGIDWHGIEWVRRF